MTLVDRQQYHSGKQYYVSRLSPNVYIAFWTEPSLPETLKTFQEVIWFQMNPSITHKDTKFLIPTWQAFFFLDFWLWALNVSHSREPSSSLFCPKGISCPHMIEILSVRFFPLVDSVVGMFSIFRQLSLCSFHWRCVCTATETSVWFGLSWRNPDG